MKLWLIRSMSDDCNDDFNMKKKRKSHDGMTILI